jgi:hypothetical protein
MSERVYSTIDECPLYAFISVTCDSKLKALIKPAFSEEDIPEDVLSSAWERIAQQYSERMADSEQIMLLSLFKELGRIETNIRVAKMIVDTLERTYVREFAEEINKALFTRFKFDVRFPVDYDNDIKRCRQKIKGIELRQKLTLSRYEVLLEKQAKKAAGAVATREYYITILMNLSDFAKYPITEQITVFEFISRVKAMNKFLEKK